MARGRFITNDITKDKRINDLSSDTSRLAFTWLITFLDCEGRTYGDPALVRSMLFPRRDDITVNQVKEMIQEWQDARLIEWYEADGDLYIWFRAFEKNQVGLRKDREAPSIIPPPMQNNSGITPDEVRTDSRLIKLNIIKLNREEEGEQPPDEFTQMVNLATELIGLPAVNGDVKIINKWIADGVTESDIRAALQWRVDNEKPPIKTISQLAGGVETNRTMRIQAASAKPGANHKKSTAEKNTEVLKRYAERSGINLDGL